MLNRRALVFSAGKALVLLPAAVASKAFSEKSGTDEISTSECLAAGSIPDQVRCLWLCAGRAAVSPLSRKSSQ
jgi:hypothetical protein